MKRKGSFMEIGSIYEINPETLTDNKTDCRDRLRLGEVEKYKKKYTKFTASGREAIALALKSFTENKPDALKRCLLPAYMCDTVFFPFERAGWEIHFYHLYRNLEVSQEELCTQIEDIRPDLLFIHPYYGMDTWKPMRSLLKKWRTQGICIMEDVTQSYYLGEAGKEADYIVGSLRKWYPIPDGGFVASDFRLAEHEPSQRTEFTGKRLQLLTEKWDYLYGAGTPEEKKKQKADYLEKNREMEEWLDDYDGISMLSPEAAWILMKSDEEACKKKRINNYRYLYDKIGGQARLCTPENLRVPQPIHPIFCGRQATETAPASLYFPIYAQDRDDLQKFLREHDIYAPVLWPLGKENENCLTEEESYIYEHMLALPMDQRYGEEEMQRVVAVFYSYMKNKQTEEIIGIRADANNTVATGHIMRCITIARELVKSGKKVLFFTADEYPKAMLEQAGMEYICLHSPWNRLEEETQSLRKELEKCGCSKLLVDSYQVTAKYFEELKDICKIIYIDDCFEEIYPVDMIINYNAYHVRFPYKEAYEEKYGSMVKLLLGTSYVPLREEFRRSPSGKDMESSGEAENSGAKEINILLSSGGGDSYNALSGILSQIYSDDFGGEGFGKAKEEAQNKVLFHTIAGSFNKNTDELKLLASRHPNIRLHYGVKNMAALMEKCDVAISAAGTMLFELCAMQVPTVFFVSADNQKYDSEFFAKEDRMLFAGDIRENREECLKKIYRQLKVLLQNEGMRKEMKARLQEITDGNGAERIAEEIRKL